MPLPSLWALSTTRNSEKKLWIIRTASAKLAALFCLIADSIICVNSIVLLRQYSKALIVAIKCKVNRRGSQVIDYTYFSLRIRSYSTSVAEPEPQGAASFGWSRSRNAMQLRLRRWY
jgi:hypothetical protein